jgi:hypothetical protein
VNIVQREVALTTNQHFREMRRMQPRQFDVEAFNHFILEYAKDLASIFRKANPGMDKEEFIRVCVEGV